MGCYVLRCIRKKHSFDNYCPVRWASTAAAVEGAEDNGKWAAGIPAQGDNKV